jgi:hypothetical protein
MIELNFIIQTCNGTDRYRIAFTNTTYLNVGDIWNIDCDGIASGCYSVLEELHR